MKTSRPFGHRGFSLVELALALGISSFALVSILGLLNVAVDTDGNAGRDTTFAAMSSHVFNDLRSVPFDSLWSAEPQNSRDAAPSNGSPADTIFYFSNEGAPLDASKANSPDTLYKCTVKKSVDPATKSVNGNYNLLKLQLQFTWPASTASNSRVAGTQLIYGSIARY